MINNLAECLSWHWLDARASTVIVPLGSLEDRPWGPAALDCILALLAACGAARSCGVRVAPPLCYTLHDHLHEWSASLQPRTLLEALHSIAESFSRLRARMVLLNAHEGNRWLLEASGFPAIHLWDLVARLGYRGWGEQVRFEKMVARLLREDATGELEVLGARLGGLLCEALMQPHNKS